MASTSSQQTAAHVCCHQEWHLYPQAYKLYYDLTQCHVTIGASGNLGQETSQPVQAMKSQQICVTMMQSVCPLDSVLVCACMPGCMKDVCQCRSRSSADSAKLTKPAGAGVDVVAISSQDDIKQ